MGAKNPTNAKAAQQGAGNQGQADQDVAPQGQAPVAECKHKHFIAVRVEFEDGKLVENGLVLKLKLNDGSVQDIVLGKGVQSGGKYTTGRILVPADACEIIFPQTYDAECKLK